MLPDSLKSRNAGPAGISTWQLKCTQTHTHTHKRTQNIRGSVSLFQAPNPYRQALQRFRPQDFCTPLRTSFLRPTPRGKAPELVSKTPRVGLGVQHLAKIQRRRHRPAAALRVAGTKKIGAATAGVSACTRQAQLRLRSGLRTFSRGETRYDRVQLGAAGSSMRLRY